MGPRRLCWAIIAILWTPYVTEASGAAAKPKPPVAAEAPRALPNAHYRVETLVEPSLMHGIHGLAFGPDDALYVASLTGHAIYRVDVRTGAVATFLGPPRATADDLAFAPDGTLAWTGGAQAAVFSRGKDAKIRMLAPDMPGVNAIAFTRTGRLFVSRIFGGDGLYEVDPAGARPPRAVAEKIGGLNGFQIAKDDALYGPLFLRGTIVKMNIESGEITEIARGFEAPSAVKIEADGRLLAVDYMKGDLVRLDPHTGEKATIAKLPPPLDNLAIAKDGTIYASSTAFNGITAIDPKSFATRRVTWSALSAPGLLSVVSDGDSEKLLVADAWGARTIDVSGGEPTLIKRGPGVFGATAIVPNGSTYLISVNAINGAGSVQIVESATGRLLANLTNFGAPYDIKPLPDGFVVADYAVGRLTKVANDPSHTRTTLAWDFDGPVGLAPAGEDRLYVSEYNGGRVTRVDCKTNDQRVVIDGLEHPEGIAVTPEGRLIVAEVGEKRVLSVDPASGRAEILADHLPIGLDVGPQVPGPFLPTGVAIGKNGDIYVTGDIENTIYRLTPPKP